MEPLFPDHAQLSNLQWIEETYQKYLTDPQSVDPSWRFFFEGIDFAAFLTRSGPQKTAVGGNELRIYSLIHAYRRFGHLAALVNPLEKERPDPIELRLETLGFSENELDQVFPTFGFCGKNDAPLREIIDALQKIYTSSIGFEWLGGGNLELEKWLADYLEKSPKKDLSREEKERLWQKLAKANLLEQFFHMKYVGQTRFSLEGSESMIPLIFEMIEASSELGGQELLIGMAHRGRLNVMAHILEKPYAELFEEFEDDTVLSTFGHDDVKYHMGFTKEVTLSSGKKILLSMAPNPSHLESVDPVALGQVRALQVLKNDKTQDKIQALLIHGDASFAGQGVIYETLQLMNLPGYSIGGALHLVVNNQIGYTSSPKESRSTRYCTDIAKAFGCPVLHVNAEDPESCLFAARLSAEIRQKFHVDVFVDLIGYRKYGHNEGDEPSYTQPMEYQIIRSKKSISEIYGERLIAEGILSADTIEAFKTQFQESLSQTLEDLKKTLGKKKGGSSSPSPSRLLDSVSTAVSLPILQKIAQAYSTLPPSFSLHPKLKKWMQDRFLALQQDPAKPSIDWAFAECLAFGSLLLDGISVRLAGEDSQRGTFSQRHLILIDSTTAARCSPLQALAKAPTRLDVINTPLTEYAGMAFEYGYSWSDPKTLVLWEAQYGDFNNGAQIIIDQYLVSGEKKWSAPSSLTLLLPHAYEGAGPEHSSARLERFLQLAADDNIQVVNASTPAQYFHLLRRQAHRKKPLIVFTPKSLLRSPLNSSCSNDLTSGSFSEILDDPTRPSSATKLLFCSGKIYYDLLAKKNDHLALIRIEQLYPLHLEKLTKIITSYSKTAVCAWVQEEPENAGAWDHIRPLLEKLIAPRPLLYIGRPADPTTATGSHKKHKEEQIALVERAIGTPSQTPPKD